MTVIVSAPSYFKFITQDCNVFFNRQWDEKRKALMLNLTWIDDLENKLVEKFSRDYESDDFPCYDLWPRIWFNTFNQCSRDSHIEAKEYLSKFQYFKIENCELYLDDDKEEVYFSTPHYDHGSIVKMMATDDYDSALTAAYAYLNEYREWEIQHKANWEHANLLSMTNNSADHDSLVGTLQECDGCSAYTTIVREDLNGNVFCQACSFGDVTHR